MPAKKYTIDELLELAQDMGATVSVSMFLRHIGGLNSKRGKYAGAVRRVYDYHRDYHPKALKKLPPSSPLFALIRARLADGYTVEQLQEAIYGCHGSRWHVENNQTSLELIMRNTDKVDGFRERVGPQNKPSRLAAMDEMNTYDTGNNS